MSIKLRLGFLLGLLLLVFVCSLAALRTMERRQLEESLQSARREEADLLNRWLDLGAAPLRRLVEDLAEWPGLVAPPVSREVADYLRAARVDAGLDAVWVVAATGTPLHTDGLGVMPAPAAFPLATAPVGGLHHFAVAADGELWEIRGRAHAGGVWIFAARRWDARHLLHIGGLAEAQAKLVPPARHDSESADLAAAETSAPDIVVERVLADWRGAPLRVLRLVKPAPDIGFRAETDSLKTKIFLAFGLCLIGSLALSLHSWILRPLGWITDSLSRQDPAPIAPLLEQRNELTRVARLIQTSFEHREQLRREIAERRHAQAELQKTLDERARLGRNLHDSVIQSIYAAGMGLVAARKLARGDPAEAEHRLAQVGDLLNDTIRDVRDFITGLEPESLTYDSFAHTIERLFATTNPSAAARLELDLDEDVVARLDPSLRTELLLVLREAISNAIRHGAATQLEIALLPVGQDRARLKIADDGRGFDPATVKRGRGLDNLAARAGLRGARIELHSQPGAGTRLALEFPLPEEAQPSHAAPATDAAPAAASAAAGPARELADAAHGGRPAADRAPQASASNASRHER